MRLPLGKYPFPLVDFTFLRVISETPYPFYCGVMNDIEIQFIMNNIYLLPKIGACVIFWSSSNPLD